MNWRNQAFALSTQIVSDMANFTTCRKGGCKELGQLSVGRQSARNHNSHFPQKPYVWLSRPTSPRAAADRVILKQRNLVLFPSV